MLAPCVLFSCYQGRHLVGLHAPLAERGAEVDVVDMQHVRVVERHVDALGAARLARLP